MGILEHTREGGTHSGMGGASARSDITPTWLMTAPHPRLEKDRSGDGTRRGLGRDQDQEWQGHGEGQDIRPSLKDQVVRYHGSLVCSHVARGDSVVKLLVV